MVVPIRVVAVIPGSMNIIVMKAQPGGITALEQFQPTTQGADDVARGGWNRRQGCFQRATVLGFLLLWSHDALETVPRQDCMTGQIPRVDKDLQASPAVFSGDSQPFFGGGDQFFVQFRTAEGRVNLQVSLAMAFRVQDGGNLAGVCLPEKDMIFERDFFQVGIGKPDPVIQAGDMPAEFTAAIEQHHPAQKLTDAPVVFISLIRLHRQFHFAIFLNRQAKACLTVRLCRCQSAQSARPP
jgi:hypothetical protein